MAIGNMFDTAEDRAVNHAYDVLRGNTPDGTRPTAKQIGLLRIVADCRGAAKAIQIGRLAEMLKGSPRDIKNDVRELRLRFKVRIGSSRDAVNGGYYLITNSKEALDTARPFVEQAKAEFEIARAILEPHEMRELEGQLRFTTLPSAADLDAVAAEDHARQATSKQDGTDA